MKKTHEAGKEGAILDVGDMAQVRATTIQQEREDVQERRCMSLCSMVEEWKDCEELEPKPEEKWRFFDRKSEGMKHRTEWCGCKHISVCEMREKQRKHADSRNL